MAGFASIRMQMQQRYFKRGATERCLIFITARAQKPEIDRYLELGAIGVIKKPFEPVMLADEILRIWTGRL